MNRLKANLILILIEVHNTRLKAIKKRYNSSKCFIVNLSILLTFCKREKNKISIHNAIIDLQCPSYLVGLSLFWNNFLPPFQIATKKRFNMTDTLSPLLSRLSPYYISFELPLIIISNWFLFYRISQRFL